MATLKSPIYISLQKTDGGYNANKLKVMSATSVKPAVNTSSVVIKIDVEIDESAFDPIFDTNSVIMVGGKPAELPQASKKKVTVKPNESIVAGLQQIDKDMKKLGTKEEDPPF